MTIKTIEDFPAKLEVKLSSGWVCLYHIKDTMWSTKFGTSVINFNPIKPGNVKWREIEN